MRVTEKLALIDKIGRELQNRFSYVEIDAFLAEYKVSPPQNVTSNSKWIYSKAALSNVPEETVLKIADDLQLPINGKIGSLVEVPRNWRNVSSLRLFISHISKEKLKAARLKYAL
ncbi:hypothetical protein [Asticcacaulis endophyticus]|uniref:Uncharacterized protein n=1 Tax=Asticcacaulis endophyticus TaxID=1395890 RepID=A0A918UYK1_9CAUL|nr:hypothetical protein [Asticcacaulis endophyticus]GGZ44677.1 hypothetical protein GCM10011273_34340 [Asticcacaulis endophyticus]